MLSQARFATGNAVIAIVPAIIAAGIGRPNGPPRSAKLDAIAGNFIPAQQLLSSDGSAFTIWLGVSSDTIAVVANWINLCSWLRISPSETRLVWYVNATEAAARFIRIVFIRVSNATKLSNRWA